MCWEPPWKQIVGNRERTRSLIPRLRSNHKLMRLSGDFTT